MQANLYTCDILYTGMGLPMSNAGVVVINGVVAATGSPDTLRLNYPQVQLKNVGGIIAPPPVNAHTHLDMSAYDFRALPYFRWIPEVAIGQGAKRGLAAALAGASALAGQSVGDIVWSADVMEGLLQSGKLQGTLYFEVLGARPERAEQIFLDLRRQIDSWRKLETPTLRLGISPHTPFTVSSRLLKLVSEYAIAEALPMQIHVAEHPSELELFETGGGALWEHRFKAAVPDSFAEIIGRDPQKGLTPLSYLDELGVLTARPTLVHMVNVNQDDIARVARAGSKVVTCPRSNYNLECGIFPWADFAASGVEIALGTDSVASGQSLDIRDEVAFAIQTHTNLDPRIIVRAAVKGGHRVVGGKAPLIRRGEPWQDSYCWQGMV